MFRGKFLAYLKEAFHEGKLHFHGKLADLTDKQRFSGFLRTARKTEWVVYSKTPFGGPAQVLDYLGRYTHRVAISNHRLVDVKDNKVTFRWKDYRRGNRAALMTLDAGEFIRRFLLHVLPPRFTRLRHYGFMSNRDRAQKLARCRQLLNQTGAIPAQQLDIPDWKSRYEALTGQSVDTCPCCHLGRMICIEVIPSIHRWRQRQQARRAPPTMDSS